jgi:hypothetical protein
VAESLGDGEVVGVTEGETEVVGEGDGDGVGVITGDGDALPIAKSEGDEERMRSGRLNIKPARINFRRSTDNCYIIKALTAIFSSPIEM